MTEADQQDTHNFLYPRSRYRGQFISSPAVQSQNKTQCAISCQNALLYNRT